MICNLKKYNKYFDLNVGVASQGSSYKVSCLSKLGPLVGEPI